MANKLPRAVTPDERDYKAADLLVRGENVTDALRKAGFPESVARLSTIQFTRSKSLRIALMQRLKDIDSIPLPDAEKRADLVRMQLLQNLILDKGAKGSNMAAKLLGMDKQVDMFVTQQQQSGVFVVMAPEDRIVKAVEDLASRVLDAKDLDTTPMTAPGREDFPDYE